MPCSMSLAVARAETLASGSDAVHGGSWLDHVPSAGKRFGVVKSAPEGAAQL